MKTYSAKPSHVNSKWHVFDANGKTLGRLATEISVLLQGKHKPIYTRHILTGDYVVVVNARKIRVTGKKLQQKMYRRHSNYPGALRETPLSVLQEKYPDRVLRAAVQGMLPKTIRGRQMLRRLKIYAGATHPHESQLKQPEETETTAIVQEAQAEPQVVVETEAPEEEQTVDEATPETAEDGVEEAPSDELQTDVGDEAEEAQTVAEVSEQAEDSAGEQPADAPTEESSEEKAGN